MESIVTAAIVGTGQIGEQTVTTNSPIDTLSAHLAGEAEQKLLLTAGAWSLYRLAGKKALAAPAIPPPAASETLAPCSPAAAQLIERLLDGDQEELLPEVLASLQQRRLRLPHELLPLALTVGTGAKKLREALLPVLGERGLWLSQFDPAWKWVAPFIPFQATNSDVRSTEEILWQEGSFAQRLEILQHLRSAHPIKAREWLASTWKREKLEYRQEFLKTFEIGLAPEDEPFLETALTDRSATVRTIAASLLIRIPNAALKQRLLVCAESTLNYKQGKLIVKLPKTLDENWVRVGIAANPKPGNSEREAAFSQVLSLIPPAHWETRFNANTAELIVAASSDSHQSLIESWSQAAVLHNDQNWIVALLDQCNNSQLKSFRLPREAIARLLAHLPSQDAEQRVLQFSKHIEQWGELLDALSRPWSKAFGDACIELFASYLKSPINSSNWNYYYWDTLITEIAPALPHTCFDALLSIEQPEGDEKDWATQYKAKHLKKFTDLIKTRKRIAEEIHS
jgi:hypothetical protein